MKNITLTVSHILVSIFAYGQDTALTSIATLSLPHGSKKVNKQQYLDYSKAHFKKRNVYLLDDHAYVIDNMLVTIRNRSLPPGKIKTLEIWKTELEGVFKETKATFIESDIVTLNNNRFLIFEYSREDETYLSSYSDYINGKSIMVLIDYKQVDEQKAHQYLQKLLTNIRFNRQ